MSALSPLSQTTPTRPRSLRLAGLLLLFILCWIGLSALLVMLVAPTSRGIDFAQDYFSAHLALRSHSIYEPVIVDEPPLTPGAHSDSWHGTLRNYHPPFAALLSMPLVFAPSYTWASAAWTSVNVLLYLWLWFLVLRELAPRSRPWLILLLAGLALGWHPFLFEFAQGQWSTLLALGLAGCWLALRRDHEWTAGFLLGYVCLVKLFPALLLPILLIRGRWKTAAMAVATFAVGTLLTIGLFGWEDTRLFYAELSPLNTALTGSFPINISLTGFVLRMFTGGLLVRVDVAPFPSLPLAMVGNILVTLVLLVLAWRLPRNKSGDEKSMALGLIGMILVSPVSWVHAYLILLPVFVALALRLKPPFEPVVLNGLLLFALVNAFPAAPGFVDDWRRSVGTLEWVPLVLLQLPTLSLFGLLFVVWRVYGVAAVVHEDAQS